MEELIESDLVKSTSGCAKMRLAATKTKSLSMKMKIILTAIVLAIIGYFLIDGWVTIFEENYVARWQNITGLILFVPLPILLFWNYRAAVLGTGIYLLLGLCSALSLTAEISTGSVTIAGLTISGFNWLSLGLLVLYFILHTTILIDMQLDYKENKTELRKP